ncbi:MAG: hypothetical protein ACRDVE_19500 [Actinocrinis sp.]
MSRVRRIGSPAGLVRPDLALDPQAGRPEGREQIIARRRAAQGDWHDARRRLERAAHRLAEASPAASARSVLGMRSHLDLARKEEHVARTVYRMVADETGRLLSRLQRTGERTS